MIRAAACWLVVLMFLCSPVMAGEIDDFAPATSDFVSDTTTGTPVTMSFATAVGSTDHGWTSFDLSAELATPGDVGSILTGYTFPGSSDVSSSNAGGGFGTSIITWLDTGVEDLGDSGGSSLFQFDVGSVDAAFTVTIEFTSTSGTFTSSPIAVAATDTGVTFSVDVTAFIGSPTIADIDDVSSVSLTLTTAVADGDLTIDGFRTTSGAVPEPSSMLLMGLLAFGGGTAFWRRREDEELATESDDDPAQ